MQQKKLITALLGLMCAEPLFAEPINSPVPNSLSINNPAYYPLNGRTGPWTPRFTGQGLVGRERVSGFIDGMIPIWGSPEQLVYVDGSQMGGRFNSSVSSLGAGLRQIRTIKKKDFILGAYAFADYQQLHNNGQVWIGNPGVELLTQHQEVRVQGYIPMSQRSRPYRSMMASSIPQSVVQDAGRPNNLSGLSGHSISDTPVHLTQEYGLGIEGELGQYLPIAKGAWIRAGGYHFDYKNARAINGVEANIELFTGKNLSIIIQDNYDNQFKNKFSLGLRLNFGGPDYTQVQHIANRMEEPVIRHLARQPSGLASPVRDSFVAAGPTQYTNGIWFFSPNGTAQPNFSLASCTAENPCLNLNQTIATGIGVVDPGATLWFASGTYTLPSTGTNGMVTLADGQNLYGRSIDFRSVAVGAQRPMIEGGLVWQGSGSFNNMQITNNNQQRVTASGIAVDALFASGNLIINQANVAASGVVTGTGSFNLTGVTGLNTWVNDSMISVNGIRSSVEGGGNFGAYGFQNLTVANSEINVNNDNNFGTAIGADVAGANANSLRVTNSKITAIASGLNSGSYPVLNFNGTGITQVINSQLTAVSNGRAIGITNNRGDVEASNTSIRAVSDGNDFVIGISSGGSVVARDSFITAISNNGAVNGIYAFNNVLVNKVIMNANHSGSGYLLGIVSDNGNITVENNSVINSTSQVATYGLSANAGSVTFRDSTLNVTSTGDGSFMQGIYAANGLTTTNSTMKFNSTGSNALYGLGVNGNINATGLALQAVGTRDVYAVTSYTGSITASNSDITARSNSQTANNTVFAIDAATSATLNNTTVSAENFSTLPTAATRAVRAFSGTIDFIGNMSRVAASSSSPANAQVLETPSAVNNNSTPQSQCTLNGVTTNCA